MSANRQQQKKRQSSVMFARGTKGEDARTDPSTMPRSSTGSAYDGFGALMDTYSDDDSDIDSDDDHTRRAQPTQSHAPLQSSIPPPSHPSQPDQRSQRESWSARAQAVGQRPPDSASQNPPTLKLLGLKSQKEGGAPLGSASNGAHAHAPVGSPPFTIIAEEDSVRSSHNGALRTNPPQRNFAHEQSMSEYGDNSSRVGSTIDFAGHQGHAGHGSDGFGGFGGDAMTSTPSGNFLQPNDLRSPPQAATVLRPSQGQAQNLNPRKALTAQLGLDTPLPEGPPSPSPRQPQGGDYFSRGGPDAPPPGSEIPLQRNTSNESSNFGGSGPRTPESVMVRSPPHGNGSLPPGDPFTDRAAGRPLVSPPRGGGGGGGGSAGGPSPPMNSQMRQPPPGYNNGPPPHAGRGPSPMGAPQSYARAAPGPGFSDSQRPSQDQRRQSIFRRSMAFMTGNSGPNASQGNNYGDAGPQPRVGGGGGGGNRQSIFRRSMAFLSGNNNRPAPAPAPENPDANCPAPRVRGFDEKEVRDRRSQYWGGGGQGAEWDTYGQGSRFWRRFSAAQKHAQAPNDKMEMTSRTMREKIAAQKKLATWLAGLGGILIITAVVAIVIWRESKSSPQDANPGSINKGEHGGTDTRMRRSPIQTSLPDDYFAYQRDYAGDADADALRWEGARVEDRAAAGQPAAPTAAPTAPGTGSGNQSMQRRRRQINKRHASLNRRIDAPQVASAA